MKQNKRLEPDTVNCLEQVPPEMENMKFSPCFISGDSFTINTLLLHKYIKDSQSKLNVLSNDQIHNNLYLTVENSIEIGKVLSSN